MKTNYYPSATYWRKQIMRMNRFVVMLATLAALSNTIGLQAQGTVTFNYPWADGGISYWGLNYVDGMSFGLGTPPPHDGMMHIGASGPAGYPHNGTPYLGFINTLGIPQYVVFAWTNAASLGQSFLNGTPFGLVSVDLADPVAPSLSPIDIVFNGFKADGSMVTQTFTTPGSGSSFQTYFFNSAFASDLVRVEMPSSAWAMDNVVWVPEPKSVILLGLALLAIVSRRFHRRPKL